MQPTSLPLVDEILNPLQPDSIAVAPPPLLPLDLPTTPPEPDFPKTVELKAPSLSSTSSTCRVHPSIRPSAPVVRPLSIFDTAASAYPSFSAVKVFPPPLPAAQDSFEPSLLSASLAHILSAYPHLAGKLRLPRPDDAGRPYQKRYGRVWVEYGGQEDPGVSFSFAQLDESVKSRLPREAGERITDFGGLCDAPLVPDAAEVVEGRPSGAQHPSLAVRVTRFSDGAAVFALRIPHILADATTLNRFVSDWGDVHRALLLTGSTSSIPLPSRPLSTEALDAFSAGDLDAPFPDSEIKAQYGLLPRLEYDMWAHPELHPPGMVQSSALDPAVAAEDAARGGERGEPAPWSTWDFTAPSILRIIELSSEEVRRIWRRAQASLDASAGPANSVKITAHDAVVAHFWRLSIRARDLQPTTTVNLITGVSARSRLAPSLPPTSVGSLTFGARTHISAGDLVSPTGTSTAAALLRHCVNAATPPNIGVILHHTAHQIDPLRVATFFAGSTHLGVTSWVHSGSYAADFGTGRPLCSTGAIAPADGFGFVDDVPGEAVEGQRWWERGATMMLSLRTDVMERVLADPELRG
ncbi:hypothetical protein JCM6882_001215 [Rhodosporidiobolus microsporus]